MAKANKTANAVDGPDGVVRLDTTPEDKAKAEKWFQRGRELGDKRQFDYAIEYFVNGLEFWPDAVEEACKPLHGCAVARRQTGGKKPGLKDTMKRSLTDKVAKQAYLNSLWLFGHDPDHFGYMEGVLRNAGRIGARKAAHWAAGICLKSLESAPKANVKQFLNFAQQLDGIGDQTAAAGESALAIALYQIGVDALNIWRRRVPRDQTVEETLRDISTKLTILKGKYKDGDSYRDSVVDVEEQRELHDEQRSVQSDTRMDELIAKAQQEFNQKPEDATALKNLIDLLCRREREDDELKAISILVAEYKRTSHYRWKQVADDIRMKQLNRKARELIQGGDEGAFKEHQVAQLRFELTVYKERCERYPTDNRLKFEFGVRNFKAGRFDEAIPLFQLGRNDPKNRAACGLYLGRCFFRKGYHQEATSTLEDAYAACIIPDDELAKSVLYWLGRAQEGGNRVSDARATYGKLLQMDYNYKDVRARLAALPSGSGS